MCSANTGLFKMSHHSIENLTLQTYNNSSTGFPSEGKFTSFMNETVSYYLLQKICRLTLHFY